MDAFSYLSVLLSIIVGLAITQVLQGYRQLLLARVRVRLALVPLVWSGLLLLFATQAWWASFGLRDHAFWGFAEFTVILLQMILLYMMTAVVLPDAPDGREIDLAMHWDRERRPFFLFLLGIVVVSIGKDLMLDRHLPEPANLAFHGALAATAVAGIRFGSMRAQKILAGLTAAGFTFYVGSLFAAL